MWYKFKWYQNTIVNIDLSKITSFVSINTSDDLYNISFFYDQGFNQVYPFEYQEERDKIIADLENLIYKKECK